MGSELSLELIARKFGLSGECDSAAESANGNTLPFGINDRHKLMTLDGVEYMGCR